MNSAPSIMLIAGEASGDLLAAELVRSVQELRKDAPVACFGAGGPKMRDAGVELAIDLTQHAVIGLWEAIKVIPRYQGFMNQLVQLACERKPDVIVCVDFSGFNRRFASAIRKRVARDGAAIGGWSPKIIQYVSPQVWASRPGRAAKLAQVVDLLLCTFPFEKGWYAEVVPGFRVEFVGNPITDRYAHAPVAAVSAPDTLAPRVLLLPGSRNAEVRRHLPVMFEALRLMQQTKPQLRATMVLPNEELKAMAQGADGFPQAIQVQVGGLEEAMRNADVAITKSGTVTLELAYFRVPSVVFYKTSWFTYLIGRLAVNVEFIAMPNLLANEALFPEFIQHAATGANLAHEALNLLDDPERRARVQAGLQKIIVGLGEPGASRRVAERVLEQLPASAR